MAPTLPFITAVAVLSLVTAGSSSATRDQDAVYLQPYANGSAVVLQTIARIQQSGVFGNDNGILRRIAYVETRDGTLTNTSNGGGIWAVDENKFQQTRNVDANVRLPARFRQIRDAFGIDWLSVQWRDLQVPLYSAIASRLVLYLAPRAIPPESDLSAQADFWVQYYNPNGDRADFSATAVGLQGKLIYKCLGQNYKDVEAE